MADEMKTHILWLPASLTIVQLHSYEQWWEFGGGKKIPLCRRGLRSSLNVLFWVLVVSCSHASLKHYPSHLQTADCEAAAAAGSTSWMNRSKWEHGSMARPIWSVPSRLLCLLFSLLCVPQDQREPVPKEPGKMKVIFSRTSRRYLQNVLLLEGVVF